MKVEIVYSPRSEWPEKVVKGFHEWHVKNGFYQPKCPYCNPRRTAAKPKEATSEAKP